MDALWHRPNRLAVLALALILAIGFIGLLTFALTPGSAAAALLLDFPPPSAYPLPYPFTVQNLMHLLLFVGFGELYCRWRTAESEMALARNSPLPQDPRVVLGPRNLAPIRDKVRGQFDAEHGFLPRLVDICILQFMANRSVDQTVSVLNSSLELIQHRLDLRYSMLRYLVWVIPTIGFIGTVIGISLALGQIDPDASEQPLGDIARALGVSFYTTLVALIESAILVLLLNLVQAREESALNRAGDETLTNLINRLVGAELG
jgi:hypothetical protein